MLARPLHGVCCLTLLFAKLSECTLWGLLAPFKHRALGMGNGACVSLVGSRLAGPHGT
jgi:hypothetical protein